SFVVQEWVMSDRRKSKPHAEPAKSDRHEPLPSNSQARMVARTGLTIALVLSPLWVAAGFLPRLRRCSRGPGSGLIFSRGWAGPPSSHHGVAAQGSMHPLPGGGPLADISS